MPSVLITGIDGGIGAGLAAAFHEAGYRVLGTDLAPPASVVPCDDFLTIDLARYCTDSGLQSQVRAWVAQHHDLHCLVNNAAVQLLSSLAELDATDWQTTLQVNLTAPMLLTRVCLPILTKNSGSVLNVGSIHGQQTKPRFVSYATSKSALIGLTRVLAVDLAGQVRVNAISPAAVETDMLLAGFDNDETVLDELRRIHPVGRIGRPREIGALAVFLASDQAGFISGANIAVDGGISSVLTDL